MCLKARGFAAFLLALFAVVTCGILFATPGFAAVEACQQVHTWTPPEPTTDNLAAPITKAAITSQLVQMIRPDTPTSTGAPPLCEFRLGAAIADVVDSRAPPLT